MSYIVRAHSYRGLPQMLPNLIFAAVVAVVATGAILWVHLGEPWAARRRGCEGSHQCLASAHIHGCYSDNPCEHDEDASIGKPIDLMKDIL